MNSSATTVTSRNAEGPAMVGGRMGGLILTMNPCHCLMWRRTGLILTMNPCLCLMWRRTTLKARQWLVQRVAILNQLIDAPAAKDELYVSLLSDFLHA
jgi:hypothetical protein